jgi:hypothetical protein
MATKRLPSLATLARSAEPFADRDTLLRRLRIERPESRHLEWRQALPTVPGATSKTKYRAVRALLAFANTDGGFIVWGVDPHGSWKGLQPDDVRHFDPASLEELLRACATPAIPGMSCADIESESARFIIAHVPPSPMMPHVTIRDVFEDVPGSRRGVLLLAKAAVYCRHGAKSDLATADDYERIITNRTDRLKHELLRRVREVEVPKPSDSPGKIYRLSAEPAATPMRIARGTEDAHAILVREELSSELFEEVNNILAANSLLSEGRKQFAFGTEIYYRIYADRHKVDTSREQVELLARTALKLYAPVLYWLLMLPAEVAGSLLRELYEDPKVPQVNTLLRTVVLLGPKASSWLHDKLEAAFGKHSQPPDFYWAFKRMVRRTGVSDRRLQALRTTASAKLEDGGAGLPIGDVLKAADLAAVKLGEFCRKVSTGHKRFRSSCPDLDVVAYGAEIEHQAEKIGDALMQKP